MPWTDALRRRRPRRRPHQVTTACVLSALFAAAPAGGQETARPLPADGPAYPISSIEIEYQRDHPEHPPLETLRRLEIELGETAEGFIAPRPGVPSRTLRPADVVTLPPRAWYASAIQTMLERIRDALVERGLMGVFVAPDPDQIEGTGQDRRPAGESSLRLLITTAIVTELRTLASGERIPPEDRVNHPLHRRIRERSPIQPYFGMADEQIDLLRKPVLDRYLFHLSRHPGRQVDAAVSSADDTVGTALDYLITENRPLLLFAEVSNTGTESTQRVRSRFGLLHTQLTNNDDIFELSFETAEFADTNQFIGAYEAPFPDDRVRWRATGSWSEFTASDVGAAGDDFEGESWWAGGEIVANVYQDRELFIDVYGGARYLETEVRSPESGTGREGFLLPGVGLRLERVTAWESTFGAVGLDGQVGGVTDVDRGEIDRLGRTRPDRDWAVVRWSWRQSMFLEPLLARAAWEDITTPGSSTLAHELELAFRGQYAFDRRLIPELQQPVGGLATVRGYPESITAGDTVLLGTAEYRFHLPRAFAIEPEPRRLLGEPFRFAPQAVYGRPDWDLIFKGFLDVGHAIVSDPRPGEDDETLIGAGIGAELLFRRNLRVRLDWGFVVRELDDRDVNDGSNRLHVLATIVF